MDREARREDRERLDDVAELIGSLDRIYKMFSGLNPVHLETSGKILSTVFIYRNQSPQRLVRYPTSLLS
jgi:hypothetical protein